MGEWFEVIKASGPLGVFVAAMLVAYGRGHIATGRELQQLQKEKAQCELERERERTRSDTEIGFWREIALSAGRTADQAVKRLPSKAQP